LRDLRSADCRPETCLLGRVRGDRSCGPGGNPRGRRRGNPRRAARRRLSPGADASWTPPHRETWDGATPCRAGLATHQPLAGGHGRVRAGDPARPGRRAASLDRTSYGPVERLRAPGQGWRG